MAKTLTLDETSFKFADNDTDLTFRASQNGVIISDSTLSATIKIKQVDVGYLKSVSAKWVDKHIVISSGDLSDLPVGSYLLELWLSSSSGYEIYPDSGFVKLHINQNATGISGNLISSITLGEFQQQFSDLAKELIDNLPEGKVGPKGEKGDPGTIDDAGLISLPAFQSLQNQANKINDDLNSHGINVKDFGAVGNGQVDDSNAIQAAFDYAKTKTLSAEPALKTQYTVVMPGGVYKASNLTMSTVIKLKPLGTVVIQPVASTDTVLTIAQDNAAKDYVFNFPSQQYLRGNLIDGGSGTIYLKGTSKKGSYTGTGLVLGSTTGLGDTNPLGRYRLTGLSISNFDTLVKINTKDNYLGTFVHCHFEGGNTGVRFGDDTNNISTNSGENFEFSHCVIASCTTVGVKINSPVDANFTNSSFDFNATALELNSTIINVNILGGHFEGNDVVVKSDYTSDKWYYNQPKVNLFGTVILDPAVDPIFKGIMLLSMKSTNVTVQQQKLGSYGGLCDYNVNVMGDPDTYYQNGYSTVVSRNLCQLYNADFHDGSNGMTWTDTNGTATFEYLTSGLPNGGDFTKGLHIKLEANGTGYIDFTKIRVQAGQILSMGLYAYLNSTASGGVGPFSLVAYDANDNKLTEITDSIHLTDFKATTWAWIYSRQLIVPQQAEYVVPRIYFNGELELYTSQLYAGKV